MICLCMVDITTEIRRHRARMASICKAREAMPYRWLAMPDQRQIQRALQALQEQEWVYIIAHTSSSFPKQSDHLIQDYLRSPKSHHQHIFLSACYSFGLPMAVISGRSLPYSIISAPGKITTRLAIRMAERFFYSLYILGKQPDLSFQEAVRKENPGFMMSPGLD